MSNRTPHRFPRFVRYGVVIVAAMLTGALPARAAELYFVDAHSQVDSEVHNLSLITERMQQNGVRKTILAARAGRTNQDILDLADQSGGAIIPAIRTKSEAYNNNKPAFYQKLKRQGASGRFGAIAEVLMYHAQKGNKAPEVKVLPSDKRVQAALDVAKQNGWPFVAHIEFAALSGNARKEFMQQFIALLEHNRDVPIVLMHVGQLQPDEVGKLLGEQPNLYLNVAHTDRFTINRSSEPWTNLFQGDSIKPAWQALMKQYPDRFIFALDNVWAEHWESFYPNKVKLWRKALGELPLKVASAIAHGNAERLWHLQ
jgi:predicted TIM-barrel fold metal-dependent hydrolase